MSNGGQCCALEVCCDAAAVRTKLPGLVAGHAGLTASPAHDAVIGQLLDWMAHEGIAFAPASIKPVIQDVLTAERQRVSHEAKE